MCPLSEKHWTRTVFMKGQHIGNHCCREILSHVPETSQMFLNASGKMFCGQSRHAEDGNLLSKITCFRGRMALYNNTKASSTTLKNVRRASCSQAASHLMWTLFNEFKRASRHFTGEYQHVTASLGDAARH